MLAVIAAVEKNDRKDKCGYPHSTIIAVYIFLHRLNLGVARLTLDWSYVIIASYSVTARGRKACSQRMLT